MKPGWRKLLYRVFQRNMKDSIIGGERKFVLVFMFDRNGLEG